MTRRGRFRQPERAVVRRFQRPARKVESSKGVPLSQLLEAARRDGLSEAHLHAIRKTGKVVTQKNVHLYSEADKSAWVAAVQEYRMPTEQVGDVFHDLHNTLAGADHQDVIMYALAFAVAEAFDAEWSNEKFRGLFDFVMEAHATKRGPFKSEDVPTELL